MVVVVSCDEVLHDTTRLKQTDLLFIAEGIGHARNAAIGVDGEKLWCLLLVLGDVDFVRFVRETCLSVIILIKTRRKAFVDDREISFLIERDYLGTKIGLHRVSKDNRDSRHCVLTRALPT